MLTDKNFIELNDEFTKVHCSSITDLKIENKCRNTHNSL